MFTDIERSTELLKQLGSGYGAVLAAHRRIVRETFAAANGVEIDTQGDAFFFAFPRARDAVSAAVEVQRAHAVNEWPEGSPVRVRMGLHTGEPSGRRGGLPRPGRRSRSAHLHGRAGRQCPAFGVDAGPSGLDPPRWRVGLSAWRAAPQGHRRAGAGLRARDRRCRERGAGCGGGGSAAAVATTFARRARFDRPRSRDRHISRLRQRPRREHPGASPRLARADARRPITRSVGRMGLRDVRDKIANLSRVFLGRRQPCLYPFTRLVA